MAGEKEADAAARRAVVIRVTETIHYVGSRGYAGPIISEVIVPNRVGAGNGESRARRMAGSIAVAIYGGRLIVRLAVFA